MASGIYRHRLHRSHHRFHYLASCTGSGSSQYFLVVLLVFVLLMVFGFAELHAATRVVMPTHRQAGFEFTFWVVYKIWWHVCLDFSVFLNAM